MDAHQTPPRFETRETFTENGFCKIYQLTSARQSGQLLHSHDYTQIWYVARGSCHHWVEGRTHEMAQGEAFLLPPGIEHRTTLGEDSAVLCCEFSMEQCLGEGQNPGYQALHDTALGFSFMLLFEQRRNDVTPRFAFREEARQRVERLLRAMLEEYTQKPAFHEDALRVMILELLLVFCREYVEAPSHEASTAAYNRCRALVEDAIRHVDEHYAEPLTLDEMCRLSTVSRTTFCYLFKQLTRQTFVEYLTGVRVARAAQLLRQSDRAVAAVGRQVGFADPAHFSRTFRRTAGMSPRAYRVLQRQGK